MIRIYVCTHPLTWPGLLKKAFEVHYLLFQQEEYVAGIIRFECMKYDINESLIFWRTLQLNIGFLLLSRSIFEQVGTSVLLQFFIAVNTFPQTSKS